MAGESRKPPIARRPGECKSVSPPLPRSATALRHRQPAPKARDSRNRVDRRFKTWALSVLAGVAFLFWLLTLGSPQPFFPWPMLNYLALITCCVAGTAVVTLLCFSPRVFKWSAPAVTLFALVIYGSLDCYEIRWSTIWDDEKFDYVKTAEPISFFDQPGRPYLNYFDTCKRWSGEITYRKMHAYEGDNVEILMTLSMQGPMSASGKPHGHWKQLSGTPSDWSTYKTENKWFWYGEEISEGEWHTRNK